MAKKECDNSPTGEHKWETVEEDRTQRTDWGCIPGEYCFHCHSRRPVGNKKLKPKENY